MMKCIYRKDCVCSAFLTKRESNGFNGGIIEGPVLTIESKGDGGGGRGGVVTAVVAVAAEVIWS